MYNRYVRNDRGTYTCIPQEENPSPYPVSAPPPFPPQRPCPPPPEPPPRREPDCSSLSGLGKGSSQTIRRLLDRLHLDHVDNGDLMLLMLLFLLFQEDADEELLIALGLLLIL